jgi:hypothetical protein
MNTTTYNVTVISTQTGEKIDQFVYNTSNYGDNCIFYYYESRLIRVIPYVGVLLQLN